METNIKKVGCILIKNKERITKNDRRQNNIFVIIILALVICSSPVKAEGIDEELVSNEVSRASGFSTIMYYSYNKILSLMCDYTITFTLEAIQPGTPLSKVDLEFKEGGTYSYKPFSLDASNPSITMPIKPEPSMGTIHSGDENLYVRFVREYTEGTLMKVRVDIKRRVYGYQQLGVAHVDKVNVGTYARQEFIVNDSNLYDYYAAYVATLQISGSSIENNIYVDNVKVFNKKLTADTGMYEFFPLNLTNGIKNVVIESTLITSRNGGGELYLYKKRKNIDIKISSDYRLIGDNTAIPIRIESIGPSDYKLQIYEIGTNRVRYTSSLSATNTTIYLPTDMAESETILASRVMDSTGALTMDGNQITITKANVLNKIVDTTGQQNGHSRVIIVNDSDRYYENNEANRNLVKQIKNTNVGVYFVGNVVSEVLLPLFQ